MAALVTSFTLVWIKIYYLDIKVPGGKVTSFTLVWIKIAAIRADFEKVTSHELHARVD